MTTSTTFKVNTQKFGFGKLFVQKLLKWNELANNRQMPWKGEKDPYKIWISEIILQQTRVEQGLKYYENFIKAFPNVQTLAKAPEEKVFKLWEGLGYYSRCRNLIQTAKYISNQLNNNFPSDYDSILQLKGIGSYTAAAISSFAFNLPHAVVDGNVFRVLSRIFDIETPIDSTKGKQEFTALAQSILPKNKAGMYNQAIMDFGAIICKPVPECAVCFFKKNCKAYLSQKQNLLPVKEKKLSIQKRWLNYILIKYKDEIAIQERKQKDIWQHLHQFVLIETQNAVSKQEILEELKKQYGISIYKEASEMTTIEQRLTHRIICFSFISLELKKRVEIENYQWVKLAELLKYAFPKTLAAHLKDLS